MRNCFARPKFHRNLFYVNWKFSIYEASERARERKVHTKQKLPLSMRFMRYNRALQRNIVMEIQQLKMLKKLMRFNNALLIDFMCMFVYKYIENPAQSNIKWCYSLRCNAMQIYTGIQQHCGKWIDKKVTTATIFVCAHR